jgi:hypothetical protein
MGGRCKPECPAYPCARKHARWRSLGSRLTCGELATLPCHPPTHPGQYRLPIPRGRRSCQAQGGHADCPVRRAPLLTARCGGCQGMRAAPSLRRGRARAVRAAVLARLTGGPAAGLRQFAGPAEACLPGRPAGTGNPVGAGPLPSLITGGFTTRCWRGKIRLDRGHGGSGSCDESGVQRRIPAGAAVQGRIAAIGHVTARDRCGHWSRTGCGDFPGFAVVCCPGAERQMGTSFCF